MTRMWQPTDPQQFAREMKALREQQEIEPEALRAFQLLLGNDELLRENLRLLEDTLACARKRNWFGMGHCLPLYTQAESQRLKARLRIMEAHGVEIYHENPYNQQEQALFQELFDLLGAFFRTVDERGNRLIEEYKQHPTSQNHWSITQLRKNANICQHTYEWMIKTFCKSQIEEEEANDQL